MVRSLPLSAIATHIQDWKLPYCGTGLLLFILLLGVYSTGIVCAHCQARVCCMHLNAFISKQP